MTNDSSALSLSLSLDLFFSPFFFSFYTVSPQRPATITPICQSQFHPGVNLLGEPTREDEGDEGNRE